MTKHQTPRKTQTSTAAVTQSRSNLISLCLLHFYPAFSLLALVALWVALFYWQTPVTSLHLLLFFSLSVLLLLGSLGMYRQQLRLRAIKNNQPANQASQPSSSKDLAYQRQKISQALEASQLALWEWDLETDSIYHSHFNEIFGYAEDEIPHFMGNLQPLVHPDDYPRLRQGLIDSLKGHNAHFQCRFRIQHKSGAWRWLEDHGEVVERDPRTGKAKIMLGTRRDTTEEQERNDYLQLAWKVFEASGEAVYIIDADSKVIFINQAFLDITGYKREDLMQQDFWTLPSFAEAKDFYLKISQDLKHEGRWEGELMHKRADGSSYPQWLRVIRVRSTQGQPYTIGMFSDLTRNKEVEARLNYLAEYDELTGLANRSQFYDRLHQNLVQARLYKHKLALVVFDIDRFSSYNNSLGHHSGDKLLKMAAERIAAALTSAIIISRTGGNEFAALFKGSEEQILLLCDKLQEQMYYPFILDQQELRLTLSMGISCYPNHAHELQVLVNQADQARLSCKSLGGNRIQVYNETIRQSNLELMRLEQDLRLALEEDKIQVFFQPKMNLSTGQINAAEALARWQHPQQGFISPAIFIPLAERTGLIATLGQRVLEKSCQQAAAWYKAGRPIHIAVNIAAQQMESGKLLQEVDAMLNKYELPARMLELELTESALIEDAETAITEMQNLRTRGVSLAIDDFGTGYSSLSYLQRFPLDILKIDRSFLVKDKGGKSQATLTRAIIALGHSLGLKVVAEGVEEEHQLEELKQLGCDYAQGFVISQPVPVEKFNQLLDRN